VARSGAYMRGNDNNQHRAAGTDQQTGQFYCSANNCALTGFEQIPVPAGRPFTQSGRTPGYANVNLDAKLELGRGFEVGLQITNLFNRRYYTAGRLGVNPFSPSTVGETDASGWNYNASEWQNTSFVAPGAPRAYFLTLSYSVDLK
jgi:iron complex outermembrane receptor protein